jgi:hemerythrin-like domain-containing protein
MTHTMMVLHHEHKGMAELLILMRSLANELQEKQVFDIRLLRDIGEYLSGYPEQCHHPKEDLIFRRLQMRESGASNRGIDLLREHERLTGLIEEFVSSLDDIDPDAEAAGKALARTIIKLAETYEDHMEMEEQRLFPAAIEKLTEDDWIAIDYAVTEQDDPLFDERSTKYAKLREKIFRRAKGRNSPVELPSLRDLLLLLPDVTRQAFNTMMTSRGLLVELRMGEDSSYVLEDNDQPVLLIPMCDEEQAVWCALSFVLGRYSE